MLLGFRTLLTTFLAMLLALVGGGWPSLAGAQEFLEPEKAFRVSVRAVAADAVELRFHVARGYYLYREQLKFEASNGRLGVVELPPGKIKFDETFQKDVETYRGDLHLRIPVVSASSVLRIQVSSQGCADAGLCYPPMPTVIEASLTRFGGEGRATVLAHGEAAQTLRAPATEASTALLNNPPGDEVSMLAAVLQGGSLWQALLVFFGAGILLSLTPCVLPMVPILSSIIVGQGDGPVRRLRGLALAVAYTLGMALVYTLFGVAAGLAGEGLAAALQTPWVLAGFAAVLVLLSLSMFGAYELQLPSAMTQRLATVSQRIRGGHMAGVFMMGGLSALIVSPCVAAPLAGALVYLSHTRDVVLGGAALFSLAVGMSVPLLLVGASAGAWLPKAGPWMSGIKRFFGWLLLAVALWLVQPVMPMWSVLAAWGALLAFGAALSWPSVQGRAGVAVWARRAAGGVLSAAALMQLVGAASGGRDPLQPLAHLRQDNPANLAPLPFQRIKTVAELDAALANAQGPVMLDFYADWCVSCKEMERFTFTDPVVRDRLSQATLLKADVTANDNDDRALLRRFSLFGPPATLFFDRSDRELRGQRVVGFQDAARFQRTLADAGF